MHVVFCFLFKTLQREKEREGPSTLCTAVQGLYKYIAAPLPQADWEVQGGCPHALHFFFSLYMSQCFLPSKCVTIDR